jgi:phosphoglycerol transferase MdoB-like AlkP superfamily enzyme
MEKSLWKKYRLLFAALLYTAVLLNYLSVERIISSQTFFPFAIFCAALVISRMIPAESAKGIRHLRWMTSLFFCGFLTHFYLSLMSSGAFYARMKFIGLLNVLFHTAIFMLLYVGTDSLRRAIVIGCGFFGVLGILNHYVWLFRGTAIGIEDIASITTAIGVAGNYDYTPDRYIILLGLLVLLWAAALYHMGGDEYARGRKVHFKQSMAFASVMLFACLPFTSYGEYYKDNSNAFNYDLYFADMLATLCQKSGMEIPEYYSAQAVETFATQSAAMLAEKQQNTEDGVQPNIIAIMSESYGDLRVLGDFETNIPVTPFMDSLKENENAVTGFAYASIFGSKTANSEFEFLSGDSVLFIPNSMVYLHYFDKVNAYDSLVSVLKDQGYTASAMHPYLRAGWNRPAVYSKMGFDETMFLEDMKDVDYYRLYPSDAYNFDLIKQRFEQKEDGEKLFLFDITMQNHSGYEGDGNGYEQTVSITGHEGEFPKTELFLSEQHESDRALEELITYFANYQEPTVIVFFGDHQPKLDQEFYDWVNPALSSDPTERMKKYMVPFFIWANYDIEQQTDVRTSINYLASHMLDTLGMPMSNYQTHLLAQSQVLPVVCAQGIYDAEGNYYEPSQMLESSDILQIYQDLTINHTVDSAGTVHSFFSLNGQADANAITDITSGSPAEDAATQPPAESTEPVQQPAA